LVPPGVWLHSLCWHVPSMRSQRGIRCTYAAHARGCPRHTLVADGQASASCMMLCNTPATTRCPVAHAATPHDRRPRWRTTTAWLHLPFQTAVPAAQVRGWHDTRVDASAVSNERLPRAACASTCDRRVHREGAGRSCPRMPAATRDIEVAAVILIPLPSAACASTCGGRVRTEGTVGSCPRTPPTTASKNFNCACFYCRSRTIATFSVVAPATTSQQHLIVRASTMGWLSDIRPNHVRSLLLVVEYANVQAGIVLHAYARRCAELFRRLKSSISPWIRSMLVCRLSWRR
jgi:hypothetical protein